MASDLPPYRHDRPCPKCGQHDLHTVWVKAAPFAKTSRTPGRLMGDRLAVEEHMRRTCRTCQYEWAEAPLDSCSAVDQLGAVASDT